MALASITKTQKSGNVLECQVAFETDSPFFDGHFPNDPIVPGVAQLHTVVSLCSELVGHPVTLTGIRRMKFSRPVYPSMELLLRIEAHRDRPSARWTLSHDRKPVSTGDLEWEPV